MAHRLRWQRGLGRHILSQSGRGGTILCRLVFPIAEFELPDGRMSVSRNGGLVPPSAGDGLPALMRQTGKEVF